MFPALVKGELAEARRKHRPMNSLHEGYAVILEEFEEWWDEIKKRPENRDQHNLLKEAVQIAAMIQRTVEDCSLCASEST